MKKTISLMSVRGAKRLTALAAVLALTSVSSACGSTTSAAKGPASTKKTFVIPAILSESGGAAFLGKEEAQGLKALEKEVNAHGGIHGTPIKFQFYNNETQPSLAVSLASSILSKNYPVMLNGSVVATDAPVDKLATSNGPVIYDLSPGVHPAPHSWIYSSSFSTRSAMDAFLQWFKSKGWVRIAAITSTDASGQDGWKQLKHALSLPQYKGLKIVDHETFDDTAVSVSTQLDRIAQAKPQVILAWATGSPIEVVFKDVAQGPTANIPIATTWGNQTYAEMHMWSHFLPKQLYFPSPQALCALKYLSGSNLSAARTFLFGYTNGIKPDVGQILSWDPALIVIHALKQVGIKATASQIRHAINTTTHFAGATGVYNFSPTNHRGIGTKAVWIARWSTAHNGWIPVSGPGGGPLP